MKKIIVDGEPIIGAKTGMPRLAYLDSIVFLQIFESITFIVQKKNLEKFKSCEEYSELSYFAKMIEANLPKVISGRPSNETLWAKQFLKQSYDSNTDCDYVSYATLFPLMFENNPRFGRILRLADPFGSSKSALRELTSGGKTKLAIARALRTQAFKRFLKENNSMVAISKFTRDRFCQIYGIDYSEIEVIHPSVGFEVERKLDLESNSVSPYILSVMGQRQRKNPLFTIEGWAANSDSVDLDYINVGQVPKESLSSRAIELLKSGRLKILDKVSGLELKKLQSGATLSVFCSSGEGFGLPIAESLFHGVPVLHNSLRVFDEISGNILPSFEINDVSTFVEQLVRISNDRGLYEEARNLSWNRGTSFTHEVAGEKWSNLLQKRIIAKE